MKFLKIKLLECKLLDDKVMLGESGQPSRIYSRVTVFNVVKTYY